MSDLSTPCSLVVIATSPRQGSNSARTGTKVAELLSARGDVATVTSFDLGEVPLPPFTVDAQGRDARTQAFAPIKSALEAADGLVLVTPEWNGMASPLAKDLFMYAGAAQLGHKAGMILSVSTGMGGTYPVAELRMSGTKNNRLCWTPEHVILRQVDKVLDEMDAQGAQTEATAWQNHGAQRLHYGLDVLVTYAQALRHVRHSGAINHEAFGNGL